MNVTVRLAMFDQPRIVLFPFLPQFVDTREPDAIPLMLELSGVFMVMTLVVFVIYGIFAAAIRSKIIARPRVVVIAGYCNQ